MNIKELAEKYDMSTQDMQNIIWSMKLENIDPTEKNIEKYLENYSSQNVNIRITKNTQRILKKLKEGRETYEDTILRISTKEKL